MCGFIGYTVHSSLHHNQIVDAMLETIKHRGPNSTGNYIDNKLVFGFRRLSILDLSTNGSQPMHNEEGNVVIVFNGEVYNYKELRDDLLSKNYTFKTETDTEVIIHGYQEYGTDIFSMLRGMFAIAIWDQKLDTLILARDHFGIKPLYYTTHTQDQSLLFGSEIKSFLKHPLFIKELNKEALKPYLSFQYSVLNETFFKGVFKLQPGHYMIIKHGKSELHQYYDMNFSPEEGSLQSYADMINETLKESIAIHSNADVPVGSFLSGGVDSSYVASVLKPEKTFSVGFKDYEGIFNETNHAKDLSDILGIENHSYLVSADEFFESLSTIQYHMDEPQSNLSSVPLYFLSRLASKHVTIALSGEGADELFGGYDWYFQSKLSKKYQKVPMVLRKLFGKCAFLVPHHGIKQFLIREVTPVEKRFIGQARIFEEQEAIEILNAPYHKSLSLDAITGPYYKNVHNNDDVIKMQYIDMMLWLPGDILQKADKMSMAHSLEVRVPFLDIEVAALASKIPSHLKEQSGQTKYVFRKASESVLPESWAKREKVGFPVPLKDWLTQETYYQFVRSLFEESFVPEFFDVSKLLELLDAHYRKEAVNTRKIYTVMTFLIWYKQFFIETK